MKNSETIQNKNNALDNVNKPNKEGENNDDEKKEESVKKENLKN